MVTAKPHRPRKLGSGRSPRYEERRAARAGSGALAPAWSDAAAAAVRDGLDMERDTSTTTLACVVKVLLSDARARARFVGGLQLSPFDKAGAREILDWHTS